MSTYTSTPEGVGQDDDTVAAARAKAKAKRAANRKARKAQADSGEEARLKGGDHREVSTEFRYKAARQALLAGPGSLGDRMETCAAIIGGDDEAARRAVPLFVPNAGRIQPATAVHGRERDRAQKTPAQLENAEAQAQARAEGLEQLRAEGKLPPAEEPAPDENAEEE